RRVCGVLRLRLGLDVVARDDLASGVEAEAVVAEGGVRRAPRVGEQAEEEVAGADLPVAELAGDVRRLGDGDPGFSVESGVHGDAPVEWSVAPTLSRSRGSASGEPPDG